MILLGYIAFFDPAKETSPRQSRRFDVRGWSVKILTGDNELVTRKVCHDVAMPITKVVTGPQLAALDIDRISASAPARLNGGKLLARA